MDGLGFRDQTAKLSSTRMMPPGPFLCCPELKMLDLQMLISRHEKIMRCPWPGERRRSRGLATQLPQGLTELRLPSSTTPIALRETVEALPLLVSLDCRRTVYYPSCRLSNLKVCISSPNMVVRPSVTARLRGPGKRM